MIGHDGPGPPGIPLEQARVVTPGHAEGARAAPGGTAAAGPRHRAAGGAGGPGTGEPAAAPSPARASPAGSAAAGPRRPARRGGYISRPVGAPRSPPGIYPRGSAAVGLAASSSPSILAAHTGQYGPHPKRSVWLFVRRPRRPRQLHSSGNSSLRFRVQAPGSLLKNPERHSRHCSTLRRSSVSLRSHEERRPAMPGSLAGPPGGVRQARRHAVRGPRFAPPGHGRRSRPACRWYHHRAILVTVSCNTCTRRGGPELAVPEPPRPLVRQSVRQASFTMTHPGGSLVATFAPWLPLLVAVDIARTGRATGGRCQRPRRDAGRFRRWSSRGRRPARSVHG